MDEDFIWTRIVNEGLSWQGQVGHQQILLLVASGCGGVGIHERKSETQTWTREMTPEVNVEKTTWFLLVFFFSTASFLQSAKSHMNTDSLRDNRSLFVWGVSDVFSLSTMEPLGCRRCYFSVRGPQRGGAEGGERRDAHFAALAAIWWHGAESFSAITSFLPLRLAFNRVSLLLTFLISSTPKHHLRYLPDSLSTSFTLTQQTFLLASKLENSALWWIRSVITGGCTTCFIFL